MRHLNSGSKLGRNPSHRRATLRNLVTNLFEHGRITTTLTRAKATRPVAEKIITLGKRDTLQSRRQAAAYLMTPAVTQKALRRNRAEIRGPRRRLYTHHPRRHPRGRRSQSRHPRDRRLRTEEKRKERKDQEGRTGSRRQLILSRFGLFLLSSCPPRISAAGIFFRSGIPPGRTHPPPTNFLKSDVGRRQWSLQKGCEPQNGLTNCRANEARFNTGCAASFSDRWARNPRE